MVKPEPAAPSKSPVPSRISAFSENAIAFTSSPAEAAQVDAAQRHVRAQRQDPRRRPHGPRHVPGAGEDTSRGQGEVGLLQRQRDHSRRRGVPTALNFEMPSCDAEKLRRRRTYRSGWPHFQKSCQTSGAARTRIAGEPPRCGLSLSRDVTNRAKDEARSGRRLTLIRPMLFRRLTHVARGTQVSARNHLRQRQAPAPPAD